MDESLTLGKLEGGGGDLVNLPPLLEVFPKMCFLEREREREREREIDRERVKTLLFCDF